MHIFVGHEGAISSIDIQHSGRYLVSGGRDDETVRVWDMVTRQLKGTVKFKGLVLSVSLSPDGRYVAAASINAPIIVFDILDGITVARTEPNLYEEYVWWGRSMADCRRLYSAHLDKTRVKLWDLYSSQCLRTFDGHNVSPISTRVV